MTQLSDEVVERVARAIEKAVGTSGNYLVAHTTAKRAAEAAIAAYEAKGDIPVDEG